MDGLRESAVRQKAAALVRCGEPPVRARTGLIDLICATLDFLHRNKVEQIRRFPP
jgi:hypothetical protein